MAETVGYDPRTTPALPVVPAYRELTTWPALYFWLKARVIESRSIIFEEGRNVVAASNTGIQAKITLEDGVERIVAAVIGADGYRSIVRQKNQLREELVKEAERVWPTLILSHAL